MIIPKLRTQAETAALLGVTQGEVSKRERNAIRKLNRALLIAGVRLKVTGNGLEVFGV